MDSPGSDISLVPHVLIFPVPVQGHVNSMLKLAQLLCMCNLKVTFLNTIYIHERLLQFTDIEARFARYKSFRFEVIPDGLRDDHPRKGESAMEVFKSLEETSPPAVRELLLGSRDDGKKEQPVTCIILDGMFGFAYDLAEQAGVPVVAFRTVSACSFWAYCWLPKLVEAGHLPFNDEDMDKLVKDVPGMERILRNRDLPSFFRAKDASDPTLQLVGRTSELTRRANGFILNTFEDLDGPILSLIRTHISAKVYSIGPLHNHLKYRLERDETSSSTRSTNSLWEEDKSCLAWLDEKPNKSVLYVSFGSLTLVSKAQLRELWAGIVQSKKLFLWAIRPDSILATNGEQDETPQEVLEGTKERGCMVNWAPQEEVLSHPAIGGFFTHSGWNSTLESIVAGVPMLCWPYFADQQTNSRYVSEVWKIGMDMKDTCDRKIVESMIKELMERKNKELEKSMTAFSSLAKASISDGGSSSCNLQLLVEDIRLMAEKMSNKTREEEKARV